MSDWNSCSVIDIEGVKWEWWWWCLLVQRSLVNDDDMGEDSGMRKKIQLYPLNQLSSIFYESEATHSLRFCQVE